MVPREALGAKVILSGKLKRKVTLKGIKVTKGARAAIEAAGGTIDDPAKPADPRRRPQGEEAEKAKAATAKAEEAPKSLMATALPSAGKSARYGDLKKRLLFLLGALVVFRIGAHIPVPGIDPNVLAELFKGQQGGILGMFNMFSGGALSRFTIFALGIMPYISASIIMQLMTAV